MMNENELLQWVIDQKTFKVEYENLLLGSVSSQFSVFKSTHHNHDWSYLLKCASFLAHSSESKMHDIALRISQYCLIQKDITTLVQKNAAQFVLNKLANRRAISLAKERGLLENDTESWHKTFMGNVNWVKQEVLNSVWLKNGEKLDTNVFQKAFWDALESYKTISISAPTSAGKSHLIKQWALEKITSGHSRTIVYVVPTRALIAEVELDFMHELSDKIKSSQIHITSFPFMRFEDDKPCILVLTQERLQLWLQRQHSRNIDVLIVDEAYKLADDDRGILLQHVIEQVSLYSPNVKTVYISPLASNPEVLVGDASESFSGKYEDVTVNQNLLWATHVRGKKWKLELCLKDKVLRIGYIMLENNPSSIRMKLCFMAFALGQEGGSIIYVNRAADAEEVALQLCDTIGFDNPVNDQRLLDLIELCKKTIHAKYQLVDVLKYGVAFHYGNMPLLVREEVESLFRDGVIKFLVCTSTLVEGVNLPCRNIFIHSPNRGNGNPMNESDFWNLAGRAGRWGKDFQGNIICLDPTVWNAPKKKSETPIFRATQKAMDRHQELLSFIEAGTPRSSASENKLFESMASYLTIGRKVYGDVKNIPWMEKVEPQKVQALEKAVNSYLTTDTIPEEIIIAHPGISPLAMVEMYQYFEQYKKPHEELLVPYATDTSAVDGYIRTFSRMYNRLTNDFGNNRGYIFREALITVHWMQGRPIKRIIEERRKHFPASENINATIRNVLRDIESVARFKAPKFISCYNDILKHFFQTIDNNELAEEIEDVTLLLEMGVNTATHLSLMNLGLSRTSAVEIKEYITADDLTEQECINWFNMPNNNWRSRDLPEIVKREIDNMLEIYS